MTRIGTCLPLAAPARSAALSAAWSAARSAARSAILATALLALVVVSGCAGRPSSGRPTPGAGGTAGHVGGARVARTDTGAGRDSTRGRVAAGAADDTVEIGFGGRMRRRDLSAAVGSVVNAGYGDQRVGRIEQLLVRVPGVEVSPDGRGSFVVRVRGIRTFGRTGIDAPLWVIDGTPVVGPASQVLAGIPPMDVDRIDVLKDAAAAAIYGSLGGNGVILVRTRRAGDRPE